MDVFLWILLYTAQHIIKNNILCACECVRGAYILVNNLSFNINVIKFFGKCVEAIYSK